MEYLKLHRKKILIILGVVLLILLPLLLQNSRPESKDPSSKDTVPATVTPRWQTYDELVAEGEIAPAGKILEVVLQYDEKASPQMAVTGLKKLNGYVPHLPTEGTMYRLQVVDAGSKVLSEQPFTVPNKARSEHFQEDGTGDADTIIIPKVSFVVTLPWRDDGTGIRILDEQGKQLTTASLIGVQQVENKPDFRSIQGDKFLNPTPPPPKQSINIFVQPAFAQAADGKVDIVFVSEQYTDMNAFHAEANRLTQGFLMFEPMKTRASQFQFHTVDNTDNLGCALENGSILCQSALVKQRVNTAGVPADVIVVAINNKDDNLRGIANSVINLPAYKRAPNAIAHEFGHAFGKLLDEYLSETTDGPVDSKVHIFEPIVAEGASNEPAGDGNCYAGVPPAAEWAGIVPAIAVGDYTKECSYPNWYSSTKESIMWGVIADVPGGTGSQCFNAVSQGVLNRRLDTAVGQFPGGPVPIAACPGPAVAPSSTVPLPSVVILSAAPVPSGIAPTFFCGGSTTSICPIDSPIPSTLPGVSGQVYPSAGAGSPSINVSGPVSSIAPCDTKDSAIADNSKKQKGKHKKHKGEVSGIMELLIKFILQLFSLLIQLLGGGQINTPSPGEPQSPTDPQSPDPCASLDPSLSPDPSPSLSPSLSPAVQ